MLQQMLWIMVGLIWLAGTWLRIYRQARFYQIEEYMSGRYVRWWLRRFDRLLPLRPLIAGIAGAVLPALIGVRVIPGMIALVAVLAAVWPPNEGEIKKPFRRTGRATRLLVAAFGWAALALLVGWLIAASVDRVGTQFAVFSLVGLVVFLVAPLWLMAGNLTMTPVEAALRRRFIAAARGVLADVRPVVVGITGSYGKTTTKTFLTEILNGRWRAYATPKSYNTMMGVCLAINNDLKQDYSIEYFVVEMGAYIRGEIERICDLTPPHISIVTEVGPQHLERFGTLDNTAAAKYEIVRALPPDGVAVFNWDNVHVREMYERGYPATRIAVSRQIDPANAPDDGPRFVASAIVETLDGLRFTVHDRQTGEQAQFVTAVLGEHNVTNILLATAVAVQQGMSLQDVALRVRQLRPAESRLIRQPTPQGITIINDAYSANPAGVVSALKVLGMHTGGRRLVITPGMVELGDLHEQENRRLGEIMPQYATDVILVGAEQTQPVQDGLLAAGFPAERLRVVEELREAVDWYQHQLRSGDTVLFLNDLPDTY